MHQELIHERTRPLDENPTGAEATRSAVLRSLPDAECVHLAAPVLSETPGTGPCLALAADQCDEPADKPEYLLDGLADLGSTRLAARLVVVSAGHWQTCQAHRHVDVGVAKVLLNAGAQCVLVGMWPVPPAAGSILLRAFYSAMLQGQRASRALAEAMQTVQHTRHFAHPANWAGWLLLGGDTRLSNKVSAGVCFFLLVLWGFG